MIENVNISEIANILKVLSNENRLIIVCHLLEEKKTVSQLHLKLYHLSQSALSQHLAILKAHKILNSNKSGLCITYSIADERIRKIISALKKTYCE